MYIVGKLLFFFFSLNSVLTHCKTNCFEGRLLVPLHSHPPHQFPAGLWTGVDEGRSGDRKRGMSVKAFFSLILLPHISAPLSTEPEKGQLSHEAVRDRVIFHFASYF